MPTLLFNEIMFVFNCAQQNEVEEAGGIAVRVIREGVVVVMTENQRYERSMRTCNYVQLDR